jgi:hypothetical protein
MEFMGSSMPITKKGLMNKKEFYELLISEIELYRFNALESIQDSHHMNKCQARDLKVSQNFIDAILVDFVNSIMVGQGLDLGLYTKHLKDNRNA